MSNNELAYNGENRQPMAPGGIVPALVTPYSAAGKVDESGTQKLVARLLDEGVNGLYVGGSTGEGPLQTPEERAEFISLVVREVGTRVPVIAHVGAIDTSASVELAKHAANVGATQISAIVPYYYQHSAASIQEHFFAIADASGLSVLVYYMTGAGSARFDGELYSRLVDDERIAGVKFTSRDLFLLQRLSADSPSRFHVYSGADEVCAGAVLMGAYGAIGSTYNFMPRLFLAVIQALRQGRVADAGELQDRANRVIQVMSDHDPIAFIRGVLELRGLEVGEPRRPIRPLDRETREDVERLLSTVADFLI